MDELVNRVSTHLTRDIIEDDIHLPYADGRARAWLFEQGVVDRETQGEDGSLFHLRWNAKQKRSLKNLLGSLISGVIVVIPVAAARARRGSSDMGTYSPKRQAVPNHHNDAIGNGPIALLR